MFIKEIESKLIVGGNFRTLALVISFFFNYLVDVLFKEKKTLSKNDIFYVFLFDMFF